MTPAAGTVLSAGAGQALSVTFTPTDAGQLLLPSGATFERVEAPGRAGVLTQAALLVHDRARSDDDGRMHLPHCARRLPARGRFHRSFGHVVQ